MKTLLTLLLCSFSLLAQRIPGPGGASLGGGGGGGTCGNSYLHCRQLTIDHTQVSSTQTNFPVVLSATKADWAVTGSGGDVQHTVTQSGGVAITIPADFILADSTCTTAIAGWEFESYDSTTGQVLLWFNVASLSSSVDTTSIWVCTDKAAVSTQQMTTTATWQSDYIGVWHLTNGSSLSGTDSTSNANTATVTGGVAATTGMLDGGADTTSGGIVIPASSSLNTASTTFTYSVWAKASSWAGASSNCFIGYTYSGANFCILYRDSSNGVWFYNGGAVIAPTVTLSTGTWHHLVVTDDFSGNATVLYIDGASVGSTTWSFGSTTPTNWFLGNSSFAMQLDEGHISAVAKTANWIAAEYNNQKPSSTFLSVGARN